MWIRQVILNRSGFLNIVLSVTSVKLREVVLVGSGCEGIHHCGLKDFPMGTQVQGSEIG